MIYKIINSFHELNLNESKKYDLIIYLPKNFKLVDENKILNYDFKYNKTYIENINEICLRMFNVNLNKQFETPIIIHQKITNNSFEKKILNENYENHFNSLEFIYKNNLNLYERESYVTFINGLYELFGILYNPFDNIRFFNIMDNTFNYTTDYFNKHLKFIGGSNISYALLNYFNCGKIYLRTIYNEFKKFNYIQKSIDDLNEDDFKDEDIIIYTVSSKLNYGYVEEDYKKDINYLNKIVQLCKYKNIKFVYFSSIAVFEPKENINIHTNFYINNWYAKSKITCENIILKNILNINTYIIRPPTIQFYHNIKFNDNTLINLSLNQTQIDTKNSKLSLKDHYTYPIQINKICYLIDNIIRDYNKETFYNIQGNIKWNYDEIINGKIWSLNKKVNYGNENKIVTKYFSNDFQYNIKQKNVCVIIAGGKGERFGLINNLPKQFIEINDKKLIEITYENCHKHFDETYLVINELYRDIELNLPKKICYYIKSNHRIDTLTEFFKIKRFNEQDKICIKEANSLLLNVKLLLECLSQKQSCIGVYNMNSMNGIFYNNNIINRDECFENEINIYNYNDISEFIQNEKKYDYRSELEYLNEKNKLSFKKTHMRTIKITYPEDLEFIQNLSNL